MKTLTIALLLTTTLFVSCGKDGSNGSNGITTVVNVPAPAAEATPEQQDISNIIEDENDYRLGLGQTQLSEGLSCQLYTYSAGDRIQASIADHNTLQSLASVGTFLLKKEFNQAQSSVNEGMNILPTSMKNTYKTMYMVRCQGQVVITESDYHQFDLTSDDASVLYIDGAKVIDNDNAHGTTLKTASKFLRRGVHSFRVDYAQQGGEQSLILNMNSELLKSERFFH